MLATNNAYSYSELLDMDLVRFNRVIEEVEIYQTEQQRGGNNESEEAMMARMMNDPLIRKAK